MQRTCWATCSTSHGACESGESNSDVCWGRCVEGKRWRVSPRLGAALASTDATTTSVVAGLEVTPPVGRGHVALAADAWTSGLIRLGAAASLFALAGVRLGVRL